MLMAELTLTECQFQKEHSDRKYTVGPFRPPEYCNEAFREVLDEVQ